MRETAVFRGWDVYALNARTTHVHSVARINAHQHPSVALNAFKSNATRSLREVGLYRSDRTPWADRGSERWLWTEQQVTAAVDYVLYCTAKAMTFLTIESYPLPGATPQRRKTTRYRGWY